jgi:hypothetical protein
LRRCGVVYSFLILGDNTLSGKTISIYNYPIPKRVLEQ